MSRLRQRAESYVALRRGAGFQFAQPGKRLQEFAAHLDRLGSEFITVEAALAWAQEAPTARAASERLRVARQFAAWLAAEDPRTEVPPTGLLPRHGRRLAPYIYSDADVQALLAAARRLSGRLRPDTYATLFGLLAATGMRVGEAVALDRDRFDPDEGVLEVRDGKDGRSRLVPLHATTIQALLRYARVRDRRFASPRSPGFFLSEAGTRPLRQNIHETFLRLATWAGLSERKPRRPRIHDLRHSFAVHRVSEWHGQGLDVDKMMSILSTYLGHISPESTYWYLTATPELMALAAQRRDRLGGGAR